MENKKLDFYSAFLVWLEATDKKFYKLYKKKLMDFMVFLSDNNLLEGVEKNG